MYCGGGYVKRKKVVYEKRGLQMSSIWLKDSFFLFPTVYTIFFVSDIKKEIIL